MNDRTQSTAKTVHVSHVKVHVNFSSQIRKLQVENWSSGQWSCAPMELEK